MDNILDNIFGLVGKGVDAYADINKPQVPVVEEPKIDYAEITKSIAIGLIGVTLVVMTFSAVKKAF